MWYRGSNEAGTIVPSSYSLLWFLFYVRFIVFVQAHRRREEGFMLAESCWVCRRTEVLCNEETPERICKRVLPVVMLLSIRFFSFLFHDVLRKFRTIVFFRLIFGLWWSHGLSGFFFSAGFAFVESLLLRSGFFFSVFLQNFQRADPSLLSQLQNSWSKQ